MRTITRTSGVIAVKEKFLDNYEADSIRYSSLVNGPEKKDADFSWREYVNSHNGELLGAYENFINRSLAFIQNANKFFDAKQPWMTRTTDAAACENTLYQCVQMIANLAVLLYPFLPFSSAKVCNWLNLNNKWEKHSVSAGYKLPPIEVLFQRIYEKVIETETEKLKYL